MKPVEIEWRRLNAGCRPRDVAVTLRTVAPGPARIAESSQIRADGRLLQQLQPQIVIGHNDCPPCGKLLGHPHACPAVELAGETEVIPAAWLVRQGVCRSAGRC